MFMFGPKMKRSAIIFLDPKRFVELNLTLKRLSTGT